MSSRETIIAILVSALAIGIFLGAARVMASDPILQEFRWMAPAENDTAAYDDYYDYEADEASQDNAEESESPASE
jgi:hypothetical protein